MSTVKTNNVQIGQSVTATNNGTWYQPATPDGTIRYGIGNAGATTSDVVTLSSSGLSATALIPSGSTAPTNGMFLPTTNTLAWSTNSTERLRLDSSGNLGLGVTPSSFSNGKAIQIIGTTFNDDNGGTFILAKNANYNSGFKYIASDYASAYLQYSGQHVWRTAPSGTAGNAISFTQAMTLDASGNLLVGTTDLNPFSGNGFKFTPNGGAGSGIGQLSLVGNSTGAGVTALTLYSTSASNYRFYVDYAGTVYARTGSISVISDQREKTNIRLLETGLAEVLALTPRRFDWIDGSKSDVAGFIAQEVQEILPDLIDAYKDAKERISLRTGDMIPTLVKAIQELSAELNELKQKVNA